MYSSIAPIGLHVGILACCLTYHRCQSLGAGPVPALVVAKWAGTTANLLVGGTKNVITADVISLFTVRPVSAIANVLCGRFALHGRDHIRVTRKLTLKADSAGSPEIVVAAWFVESGLGTRV